MPSNMAGHVRDAARVSVSLRECVCVRGKLHGFCWRLFWRPSRLSPRSVRRGHPVVGIHRVRSSRGQGKRPARFFADTGPHDFGISRDGNPTYGDPFAKGANRGPLLPIYQLELPRKVSANGPSLASSGWKTARAAGW